MANYAGIFMPTRSDSQSRIHQTWNEAISRIAKALRSQAQRLDLVALDLSAVPESLADLAHLQGPFLWVATNLRVLNISGNQIAIIPDFLADLSMLQILVASRNRIATIPICLGKLEHLRVLDLSYNLIGEIPSSLRNLRDLRQFDVGNNEIAQFPESLKSLTKLQSLDASNNRLSTLPSSLGHLVGLRQLSLSNNLLTDLPESLADLPELEMLDLSGNQLSALPDRLAEMKQLTRLFLHGNPGLGIPEEILGPTRDQAAGSPALSPRPPKEILKYYFSQRADFRPLNEAKLILVGQGFVGKTSLVRALTTGEFDNTERTTEGIKIRDWPLSIANETIILHIWDFGGQEMMHATHQFFLTARSIYLLVLNRRPGGSDREADYWFRLIRAFGGQNVPVIVVLNKQRSEPFDVNRGSWLEKYAQNIRGFVETDCTDKTSIMNLRRKIQERLSDLKDLKAGFPSRWFTIKDELARMPAQYVTFSEYREICKRHGEGDPDKQTSLAGFLHDLGTALNYRHDPRLRFAYVLKPEWVTEGIYSLLHAFVASKGLFSSR